VILLNICLSNKETYGGDGGNGWVQKWWTTVAAQLEHHRKRPYSTKACREKVDKQIASRQAEIMNLATGEELDITSDWALAIDAWIEVVDQYKQRQRAAKDRSAATQAEFDRLRTIRDNMKRRMGEKDGPDDSNSTASDSGSDEDTPNTTTDNNNDANQADTPQTEGSTPRSSSQPMARPGGRRANSSNPRREKRARPGDTIEQAMMESCKEMAQCYKQLVSAVVKQSERASGRTLEASESRLIMQRQQAQEQKLAEQSVKLEKLDEQGERTEKKLDQQAQRLDQVLNLLQSLHESDRTTK
jgi:hypothetical protein